MFSLSYFCVFVMWFVFVLLFFSVFLYCLVFILRLLAAQVIAWKDWTPKALFVERDVKLYSLLTPYTHFLVST